MRPAGREFDTPDLDDMLIDTIILLQKTKQNYLSSMFLLEHPPIFLLGGGCF